MRADVTVFVQIDVVEFFFQLIYVKVSLTLLVDDRVGTRGSCKPVLK